MMRCRVIVHSGVLSVDLRAGTPSGRAGGGTSSHCEMSRGGQRRDARLRDTCHLRVIDQRGDRATETALGWSAFNACGGSAPRRADTSAQAAVTSGPRLRLLRSAGGAYSGRQQLPLGGVCWLRFTPAAA